MTDNGKGWTDNGGIHWWMIDTGTWQWVWQTIGNDRQWVGQWGMTDYNKRTDNGKWQSVEIDNCESTMGIIDNQDDRQ